MGKIVKIQEASRNDLLAITKKEHDLRSKAKQEIDPNNPRVSNRYNRSSGYKGFGIVNVDTTNLLRKGNSLVVTLSVGDYEDTIELDDVLYWIQIVAEDKHNTTPRQINSKGVAQALSNAIDGMNIKVDCTCADWYYRLAYQATLLGYKYGEEVNIPNGGPPKHDQRANPDNYGALCFTGDTEVVTDRGLIPIKDIKVGDLVFTHKGRLKKVIDIGSRSVNKLLKLHVGTQDIYCTEDHPFLTCNGRGNQFKFEEAKHIGQTNWRRCVSPVFRLDEVIDIEDKYAFMLGLYLSDGTLCLRNDTKNPTMCSGIKMSTSKDLTEFYDKKFNELGFEFSYHEGSTGKSCYYYIKSTELRDFVYKFGGMNYHDEYQKYINTEVLYWNKSAKLSLIKGFFAGDGQYCSNGKYLNMRFLNTNKNIIDMLAIIMKSLGLHVKICKYSRYPRVVANNTKESIAKDMYCITISGQDIKQIDDEWFKCIKGQKSQQYPISNYTNNVVNNDTVDYHKFGVKYKETLIGNNVVYNISVEDDESYLVSKDMIAVHNCKHLTAVLSNKSWIQQVTKTLMDWLEQNISKVNVYLGLVADKQLVMPDADLRQLGKKGAEQRKINDEMRRKEVVKNYFKDYKKKIQNHLVDMSDDEIAQDLDNWVNTTVNRFGVTDDEYEDMLTQLLDYKEKHMLNVSGNNPSTNKLNNINNEESGENNNEG